MARMIKIKCNGPAQDVNEVDLDRVLRPDVAVRGARLSMGPSKPAELPERVVLPCKYCAVGRVVMTREMIATILNQS